MVDACLIDFGRGRGSSDDWADETLETKENDELALERIFGLRRERRSSGP
jgi:hypothetical protein